MTECEQPTRKTHRGRGKSDPIDAHLAVLTALPLDAGRLPTPRADAYFLGLRLNFFIALVLTIAGLAWFGIVQRRAARAVPEAAPRGRPANTGWQFWPRLRWRRLS